MRFIRVLACFVLLSALVETGQAVDAFYVAVNGDDQNSGTREKPFATLTRARDAARNSPAPPRRIVLRGGKYTLATALVLGPEDSGLTIEAASGEAPVLCGGRLVTGWEKDGDRFWFAPVSGVTEGTWDFRQLYVNGVARPRARLPETGTWQHATTFDQPWLCTVGGFFQPPPSLEKRSALIYREGQVAADFSMANAEFVILHSWDESQTRAVAHNSATRTLQLDPPCGYPPGAFGIQDYYVLNLREGMTKPGQWYLDRQRGRVVYWPLPGEQIERCTIEAPVVDTVLRIEGRKDSPVTSITLRGLTVDLCGVRLAPSGWGAEPFDGAVMLASVRQCRIENLTVCRVGGQALKILNADETTIDGCNITHTGANGLVLQGGTHNAVVDTCVQHAGEIYLSSCGINASNLTHSRLAHNNVADCAYCGIALGNGMKEQSPAENSVEYNCVRNVMTGINDGGCIYLYGVERNTVVRGNVLHSAHGRPGGFAIGLYLDENCEDVTCEENIVYDISLYPLHAHMGKRNIIRNNIFVCGPGCRISFDRSSDCICERNIFYGPETGIQFSTPGGARFADNVYFPGEHAMTPPPSEKNPLIADPLFEDPAKADFRLRVGSPALRVGFRPIDPSRAGLCADVPSCALEQQRQ